MRFLFWNINKHKGLENLVCELVHENDADILIMAESELDERKMLIGLNELGKEFYRRTDYFSEKIEIYSRYRKEYLDIKFDDGNMSAREISLPGKESILVVGAHFPSKMNGNNEEEQLLASIDIAENLKMLQEKVNHKRIILVGDLNMNPFESGMTSAKGLHATMDKRIASRKFRVVKGKTYDWFYNPMWGKLGDNGQEPPGTFFQNGNEYNNIFWNMLDQVIISHEMVNKFNLESLKIIGKTRDKSLLTKLGRPNKKIGSDHLPLFFELLEKE